IRINPDISASTHRYITTGESHNKFGLDYNAARWIFLNSGKFPHVHLRGVHIHIGSQIVGAAPFVRAIKTARDFAVSLKNLGVKIEYLNIGGGLGIIYKAERAQTADEYAKAILPVLGSCGLKLIMEPGRFICGNAGILVTRVAYVKKTTVKNFIIVDSGMNDLVRPMLYEAYHEIVPLEYQAGARKRFDVVGPICESGDFFALGRQLVEPKTGDYLAILSAGAYGFTMSGNYNSRPRCSEVMVSGRKHYVVRKRETKEDLVRGETIPQFLR
ncbi:MAG: diaminopimelate decarboxylase, partial [Candidatus Omnitrophota bacterium]